MVIGWPLVLKVCEKSPLRCSAVGTMLAVFPPWRSCGALVVEEEEGAVAAAVEFRQRHRSAERAAVGVLVELALLEPAAIAEEVVGVERFVAEVVVHRSVPLVCAGPGRYIDEGGRRVPVFRVEGVGLRAHLFHGIG